MQDALHNVLQQPPCLPAAVADHLSRLKNAFQQIPVLDLQHPPNDGSLVVFNAMVQDTSISPELYLPATAHGPDDSSHLKQCFPFWIVSIPGLSPWCANQTAYHSIHPHKFPLPQEPHLGLQLKIYDEQLAHALKTTDIMSFVGILTIEPKFSDSSPLVPTLHLLFHLPIPCTFVPRLFPDASLASDIITVRQELINWLANEALAGDRTAAEYVLLCAISRVYSRQPPILPLSLTISNFPSPPADIPSAPTLFHVLSLIFPLVSNLPLSLEKLNTVAFAPESKDEDLHSGRLQLPKGSLVFVTENAVKEGKISTKGLANINLIQDMMKDQILEYIFPFSSFHFESDVNFLIATEGSKSTFFKTDINIPLCHDSLHDHNQLYKPTNRIVLPPLPILLQFRQLVGASKTGNVKVGPGLGKYIEDDFVAERSRKTDGERPGFSPDDLIRRLQLSKLVSLSFHQTEVTVDNWNYAKQLESGLAM